MSSPKLNLNLTDKGAKKHIRLYATQDGWERWESKDKRNWTKTHENLTLDNVLKEKMEVQKKNYFNLFKLITRK